MLAKQPFIFNHANAELDDRDSDKNVQKRSIMPMIVTFCTVYSNKTTCDIRGLRVVVDQIY